MNECQIMNLWSHIRQYIHFLCTRFDLVSLKDKQKNVDHAMTTFNLPPPKKKSCLSLAKKSFLLLFDYSLAQLIKNLSAIQETQVQSLD